MTKNSFVLTNRTLSAALLLIAIGAFFRVVRAWVGVDVLPNFSPLPAIALCAAAFLPGGVALLVTFAALVASDVLLNAFYGFPLLPREMTLSYFCYAAAWGSGIWLRRHRVHLPPLLGLAIANAILFYVATNTASWFGNPLYPQSFAGWIQSLTVGLPGFPHTWTFFRNSLVSDLLFTAVFYAIVKTLRERDREIAAETVVAR